MAKCKDSWIDGYRKGISEQIEKACFEAVNIRLITVLAERIDVLEEQLKDHKNPKVNCGIDTDYVDYCVTSTCEYNKLGRCTASGEWCYDYSRVEGKK